MDLQRIVSSSPRHPGTQKLGHPSLKVTAAIVVFFPSREISELPCHHDLNGHHSEFACDSGELDQRLPKLLAVLGILQAYIQCRLGYTHSARSSLDPCGLKGLHQLLEALSFFGAQEVRAFHFKAVKRQLIFFHAPIAENLDFAARHALGGEGSLIGSWRLLGQKHRQTFMVGAVRIRARQKCHHMGARRMGDPCLVASDLIVSRLVFHGACAQGAEVGASVWLGKYGSRQDFGTRELGEPVLFLLLRTACEDQFSRNLRACAE